MCSTACALPLSSPWMRLPPVGCRGCCVRCSWQIPALRRVPAWETPAQRSTKKPLGVPVIAVGVPTVVDGATLAHEIGSQLGQPACEALDDLSQPVMITTRDIDREVADISRMIGYAVNMALHPHLSVADIDLYLS